MEAVETEFGKGANVGRFKPKLLKPPLAIYRLSGARKIGFGDLGKSLNPPFPLGCSNVLYIFQSLALMHTSCILSYSSSASDSPLSLPDPPGDPVESGMTTSFRYVTYNVISQYIRVSYRSVHNYSRGAAGACRTASIHH